MKIAFLFIAEAYQAYHGAAVLFELRKLPGVRVDVFHNDPEVPAHLARIGETWGEKDVYSERLAAGAATRLVQTMRVFGLEKTRVLKRNEERLRRYDAIISLEAVAHVLFAGYERKNRPALILMTHGAGDRFFPALANCRWFDLILVKGRKDAERYTSRGFAQNGHIAATGNAKLETTGRMRSSAPTLFNNDRPIVLYNPHKARGQGSWSRFAEPLLQLFERPGADNLIVAPHVKMFRRRSRRVRDRLRVRSRANILVDPGSPASLDGTYSDAADIYVGDVSSQVYDFLVRPRPCVFLNAHGIDWQDDPHFVNWHLGEVIEDPADLEAALGRAPRLHENYVERQRELASASNGEPEGAARRSAETIVRFLEFGRV